MQCLLAVTGHCRLKLNTRAIPTETPPPPYKTKLLIQYADMINTRGSQGRIFGIATRRQVGWSKVGARDVCLVKNIQAGSWSNPAFYSLGAGSVSQRYSVQVVTLTTHCVLAL